MNRFFRTLVLAAMVLFAAGCSRSEQISVMTFNIRLSPSADFDGENSWEFRKTAVVKMLSEAQPDLFGIQEGIIHQVNYMEENLPEYGRYGVCRDDGLERGEANAIFWKKDRFDLVKSYTFWLSETPDTVSLGWDGACRRIVTWAQLHDKKLDRDVYYFNTHFDHVGVVAREEAAKLIMQKMREFAPEDAVIFLTGDLNVNYDNPVLDELREFLGNAREQAPVTDDRNTFNYWGKVPFEGKDHIIDHIFFRNAEPVKYELLTGDYGVPYISDHYPVMATFEVRR